MNVHRNFGLTLSWEPAIREAQYRFAARHDLGLEIVGFAWYDVWNDASLRNKALAQYKQEMQAEPRFWSLHGPIHDILLHSMDATIRHIAEERVIETTEIALQLGITKLIFHPGINTSVTDPSYYENALTLQAEFWSRLLEQYKDITICLENVWEPDPGILEKLLQVTDHARLKICLDLGHVNVYSRVPLRSWIEELGSNILHLHLHDNHGDLDSHLPVGQGAIDWHEFSDLAGQHLEQAQFILEVMTLEGQKISMDVLLSYFS